MSEDIFASDNGVILEFTIMDGNTIVDITDATVIINFKYKDTLFVKQATVTNGLSGLCEVELESVNIESAGTYKFQAIVKFHDGDEFASDIQWFNVKERLI